MLLNPSDEDQNREAVQASSFEPSDDTRGIAYASAMKTETPRRDKIESAVIAEGRRGLIAWEIAEALRIPYTSVQSPLKALVASGRLRKTGRTRLTGNGSPAVVYVSSSLREDRDDG